MISTMYWFLLLEAFLGFHYLVALGNYFFLVYVHLINSINLEDPLLFGDLFQCLKDDTMGPHVRVHIQSMFQAQVSTVQGIQGNFADEVRWMPRERSRSDFG
ncbi:hypothetical protein BDV38DRAFT_238055 [Aspergillus pseudotamarii]|uniref:Uncharacterized protein n=1 Tax=Aspergillus pseudotamarii TaxID=132259 RepID=A0A5N6T599_ASPPS|nr:uncharacterized protein BDV38DRAFT_238055 [Aspergillus pseudotamarii]KAE8141475.1 hypothetical protein BDV38DRAFT_238055 [Aspergillus pseudotamarii]